MKRAIRIFFILLLLLCTACTEKIQSSSGELSFYFCHLIDCDEVFIEYLSSASSLDCAFYDLDNLVIHALLEERNARVVVDEHEKNTAFYKVRKGDGLMHNKFCIVNDSLVITGSYNPTTKNSFDNVIVIGSSVVANHYKEQFSQLLSSKKSPSKDTVVFHNGMRVEMYACPQDDCAKRIYELISLANKSIYFSLFTFTDKEVSSLLLEKELQGLEIKGLVESFQSKKYNQYYVLKDHNVSVYLEDSDVLAHNKVFIIDESIVITGSFNPTRAANTINDENIIIFFDSLVARHYTTLVEDTIKRTQSFKYGLTLS